MKINGISKRRRIEGAGEGKHKPIKDTNKTRGGNRTG